MRGWARPGSSCCTSTTTCSRAGCTGLTARPGCPRSGWSSCAPTAIRASGCTRCGSTEAGSAERDPLCERGGAGEVDRRRGAAHVGLPRVRPGLPAPAGGLLATEGATDLGAGGPGVDIGDAGVGMGEEALGLEHVVGEDAARQPLGYGVVELECLVQVPVADDVQDRGEGLRL